MLCVTAAMWENILSWKLYLRNVSAKLVARPAVIWTNVSQEHAGETSRLGFHLTAAQWGSRGSEPQADVTEQLELSRCFQTAAVTAGSERSCLTLKHLHISSTF